MKTRCSNCGTTKFGLVRQWGYYLTGWGPIVVHIFCKKKCMDEFDESRRKQLRYRRWLYS